MLAKMHKYSLERQSKRKESTKVRYYKGGL